MNKREIIISAILGFLVGGFFAYQIVYLILKENYIYQENRIQSLMNERYECNNRNYEHFKYSNTLDSAINSNKCCSLKIYNFKLDYYSKENQKN